MRRSTTTGGGAVSGVNIFLAVVYFFYTVSPIIKDELWLRVALLVTSIGFVTWGFLIDDGIVTIVANSIFVVLSVRHIVRLLKARRPVELSADQQRVHEALFATMSTNQFALFWAFGRSATTDSAETLTSIGEPVELISVVVDGAVVVRTATTTIERHSPNIVGEISFLRGPDATASADVVAAPGTRLHQWGPAQLRMLERTHPDLALPFMVGLSATAASRV